MDNLSKVVDLIQKLRVRTVERGATASEAETAAVKIGRLLMKHPELGLSILSGEGQMEALRFAQKRDREQWESVLRQRAEAWPQDKRGMGGWYDLRSYREMRKP